MLYISFIDLHNIYNMSKISGNDFPLGLNMVNPPCAKPSFLVTKKLSNCQSLKEKKIKKKWPKIHVLLIPGGSRFPETIDFLRNLLLFPQKNVKNFRANARCFTINYVCLCVWLNVSVYMYVCLCICLAYVCTYACITYTCS